MTVKTVRSQSRDASRWVDPLDAALLREFVDLATRLSPEWLTCDGECSAAEINRRYAKLMREWRALERQAGRAVTEDDEGASLMRCAQSGQRAIVAPSWAWEDARRGGGK